VVVEEMVHQNCRFVKLSDTMKALGHPVRLCIMNKLLENGPCNVVTLQHCLRQPQSTVSQHLQKLRNAGLVRANQKGLEKYYTINGNLNQDFLKGLFKYNQDKNKLNNILPTIVNY
jgi:ArsR family transcriptional regulator